MRVLSCAAVRRRIEAWHDGELMPAEQCAVAQHLDGCPPCAARAVELETIREALRARVGRTALSPDVAEGLRASVLGRADAEAAVAFHARMAELFQDMHLVWAGLSATAAAALCLVMLLGMVYFSPPEREDSLAGILSALAAPGSDRNPVSLGSGMDLPRVSSGDAVPAMLSSSYSEEDLVFALAAVVTQEGRVSRSEVLQSTPHDREAVLRLMNAVSAARFRPASVGGEPVAVNLVWLVTHTTVRGKTHS
jgi:hypothetical protein